MAIGERIRAFRVQRDMTQKQLGKACGEDLFVIYSNYIKKVEEETKG